MIRIIIFCLVLFQNYQEHTGIVSGFVTDADGIPIAEATVVITAGAGAKVQAAGTGEDGRFNFTSLPASLYTLWVATDRYAIYKVSLDLMSERNHEGLEIKLPRAAGEIPWTISPSDKENFRRATLLMADFKPGEALPLLLNFLQKYPYLVRTHYNVGLCYVELAASELDFNQGEEAERFEKLARSHLEVVLQRYPDFSPALMALGQSYIRSLKMDEAAVVYEKLVTIVPHYPDVWYSYAEVLGYLKQLDRAESAFRMVLEINPEYVEALARIGAVRQAQKDYRSAIEYYKEFLQRAPNSDMAPVTRELLEECRMKLDGKDNFPEEK
jgi:tetratricopeptide (TPR) repeat protein